MPNTKIELPDLAPEQMFDALLALPAADLIGEARLDDRLGDGSYYSGRTVVRLLREARAAALEAAALLAHEAWLKDLNMSELPNAIRTLIQKEPT